MSNRTSDSTSLKSPPPPLSPFSSTFSMHSEVTSDDPPDLGDFTTVFRALQTRQPPAHDISPFRPSNINTESRIYSSDYESDNFHSTVWDHDPVRSYLASDVETNQIEPPSSEDELSSNTEDERIDDLDLDVNAVDLPTLGAFDAALGFLAGERAKLAAQVHTRERSDNANAKNAWQHVISPRRKRRRKRRPVKQNDNETVPPIPELSSSSAELSSSPEHKYTLRQPANSLLRLNHSHSTPNLLMQAPAALVDPPSDGLRRLAVKLMADFPKDVAHLKEFPRTSGDLDTRNRPPDTTPLIHIFIDHSNILLGFLSFMKQRYARERKLDTPEKLHLSHGALSLILERGRNASRRVMVASSPLWQPMEDAQALGYEVRIFARVPDSGDGMDRLNHRIRKHSSTPNGDSDPGTFARRTSTDGHSRTLSASVATVPTLLPTPSPIGQSSARVRYREQGVDELLQLKLHQAIVDIDNPPAGSTIVLATGDGNMGEFNEEGFIGCVRTALRKGWNVELYAWEEGLSRSWAREFGDKAKFKIIRLEKYATELLLT